MEILGPNPLDSKAADVNFHPELATRWGHGLKKGVKRSERHKIMDQYSRSGNCDLEAPLVNLEVASSWSDTFKTRDGYLADYQVQLGSAIAAVGKLISEALVTGINEDNKPTVSTLSDVGTLLIGLHHQISSSRRLLILQGVDKAYKELVEKLPLERHLFGENLAEVLKSAGAALRLGLLMKQSSPPAKQNSSGSGNAKTPSGKRGNRAGRKSKQANNPPQNGQNKPRPNTRQAGKSHNPPANEK